MKERILPPLPWVMPNLEQNNKTRNQNEIIKGSESSMKLFPLLILMIFLAPFLLYLTFMESSFWVFFFISHHLLSLICADGKLFNHHNQCNTVEQNYGAESPGPVAFLFSPKGLVWCLRVFWGSVIWVFHLCGKLQLILPKLSECFTSYNLHTPLFFCLSINKLIVLLFFLYIIIITCKMFYIIF